MPLLTFYKRAQFQVSLNMQAIPFCQETVSVGIVYEFASGLPWITTNYISRFDTQQLASHCKCSEIVGETIIRLDFKNKNKSFFNLNKE